MPSRVAACQTFADPSGGPEGQCSFCHFGAGQGGTAAANIERWYGQFQEPRERLGGRVSAEEVGGARLHLFPASGTFLSGMPGGEQRRQPLRRRRTKPSAARPMPSMASDASSSMTFTVNGKKATGQEGIPLGSLRSHGSDPSSGT